MDRLNAGVNGLLQVLCQIVGKRNGGNHVRHILAVVDLISAAVDLPLIMVINAVKLAVQIILIVAPGNTRHQVNDIAVLLPVLDAFFQIVEAVHHDKVALNVKFRRVVAVFLYTGALLSSIVLNHNAYLPALCALFAPAFI